MSKKDKAPAPPAPPGLDDIEQAAKAQAEIEDLSKVDVGLDSESMVDIYANERLSLAIGYQRLYVRAFSVKASVSANRSIGNIQAQQTFEKQLVDLERDKAHLLRSIKTIDQECPAAKKRMKELERVQREIEKAQIAARLEASRIGAA